MQEAQAETRAQGSSRLGGVSLVGGQGVASALLAAQSRSVTPPLQLAAHTGAVEGQGGLKRTRSGSAGGGLEGTAGEGQAAKRTAGSTAAGASGSEQQSAEEEKVLRRDIATLQSHLETMLNHMDSMQQVCGCSSCARVCVAGIVGHPRGFGFCSGLAWSQVWNCAPKPCTIVLLCV